MPRTASVFNFDDLPGSAKAKERRKLSLSDLSPAQRALAESTDITAIVEGDTTTVLAPSGDFPSAVKAVRLARGLD